MRTKLYFQHDTGTGNPFKAILKYYINIAQSKLYN